MAKSFRIKTAKFLIKDGKFAVGEGACGCCGGCSPCIRITLAGLPPYLSHLNGVHEITGEQSAGAGTPEDTSDDVWGYDLNMIITDTSDLLPCHVDVGGYSSAITLSCSNDGQFAATLTAGFSPGSPTTIYASSSTVGSPLVYGENEITGFYGSGCAEEGQEDTYVDEYFDGVILDGVILSPFTATLEIEAIPCESTTCLMWFLASAGASTANELYVQRGSDAVVYYDNPGTVDTPPMWYAGGPGGAIQSVGGGPGTLGTPQTFRVWYNTPSEAELPWTRSITITNMSSDYSAICVTVDGTPTTVAYGDYIELPAVPSAGGNNGDQSGFGGGMIVEVTCGECPGGAAFRGGGDANFRGGGPIDFRN